MATNFFRIKKGANLQPTASPSLTEQGDLAVDSSTNKISFHNGTSASPVVTEAHTATLTNKTIDAASNTISNIANANISSSAAIAYSKLALSNSIVNADIASAAAIAYSKLALSNSIVNADINASAAIAYSKLALASSIVNADIAAGAAIAYSKLNLSGSIVNADVATGAAIARSKLASGSNNHVLINDGSGVMSSEAQLASTRGGTGVNNAGTLTYGSNNVTLTTSGATNVTLPTSGTLSTLAGSESLSNKTFSDAITQAQISTPSTPSSGFNKIYPKSDGYFYSLDPSGAERKIGSGTGTINYITNPDFEGGTTGWAAYADAAGTQPVDGTGGSPTVTITRTTSSPLRGTGSGLLTKDAANRQGEGVSYAFTIDNADQGKPINVSFDYTIASGTFATGDLTVYIVDVTNGTVIQPSGYQIVNTTIQGTQIASFQAASNSTSYRLCLHVASTSTSAYTVKFDNVNVGPSFVQKGAVISDWVSFTPTGTWVSNATYTGRWRRIGDSAEVQVNIALSGATTAAILKIDLPSGLSIDTSKITNSTADLLRLGSGRFIDTGVQAYPLNVFYSTATSVIVTQYNSVGTNPVNDGAAFTNTSIVTVGNTDTVNLTFIAPILGWSSNLAISTSSETRVVSLSAKRGSSQSVSNTTQTDVVFDTVNFDTHGTYNNSTGVYTIPVAGYYKIVATLFYSMPLSTSVFAELYVSATSSITSTNGLTRLGQTSYATTGATGNYFVSGEQIFKFNAGDTFKIQTSQSSGGSRNILSNDNASNLSVEMVSGPAQIAASENIYASYGSSSTATTSGTPLIINYETKNEDSHGAVTTGASWKFTAPAPGEYRVSGTVTLAGATYGSGVNTSLGLYKNGSGFRCLDKVQNGITGSSQTITLTGSSIIYLQAGDYIDLRVDNNGGVAINGGTFYNHVSISRVGGLM